MWSRRAVLRGGTALGALALLPMRPGFAATDQLRLGLSHEPPNLDPTAGDDPATLAVSYQNLFEGLTRIDEQGNAQPCLAKSWALSANGLTYSFALHDQVHFHDGTSFDAAHAVFTLNRLRTSTDNPGRAAFAVIANVVASDQATLQVTLKAPAQNLLVDLGRPAASMVAPESADNNRQVPIGTGSFALTDWHAGNSITLERNEDYWGVHPRINAASFVFIADPAAALAALLAGQIDGFPSFPAPALLEAVKSDPAITVTTGTSSDGKPRFGVWNSQLLGMWRDAPVESCVLAGIRWSTDNGLPDTGPAPPPVAGPGESTDD
jgi:peptide/nickel transport system substrate-binding protein